MSGSSRSIGFRMTGSPRTANGFSSVRASSSPLLSVYDAAIAASFFLFARLRALSAVAEDLLPLLSEKTAFVYVDRPNNPTGQTLPLSEIEMLCRAAWDAGAYCVVDEAYGDFLPRSESTVALADRWENLIVIRSFSKGYGTICWGFLIVYVLPMLTIGIYKIAKADQQ